MFTDIQMPGRIDGIALTQWIRRERPHVRVILTSGNVKSAEVIAELGAAVLVPKPYRLPEIADHIAAIVQAALEHTTNGIGIS